MGQSLYAPPSVAGWDGGPAWINTTTTLERSNLRPRRCSRTRIDAFGERLNPKALAEKYGGMRTSSWTCWCRMDWRCSVKEKIKGSEKEVATLVLTARNSAWVMGTGYHVMDIKSYRDLRVSQAAMDLVEEVYRLRSIFPRGAVQPDDRVQTLRHPDPDEDRRRARRQRARDYLSGSTAPRKPWRC